MIANDIDQNGSIGGRDRSLWVKVLAEPENGIADSPLSQSRGSHLGRPRKQPRGVARSLRLT